MAKKKPKIPFTNHNSHKKLARLSQAGIVSKYPHCKYICSLDETGWGAAASNCTVACVVLPIDSELKVKDSKKYSSEKARRRDAEEVKKQALWYKVVEIPAWKINLEGLGRAKNKATIALLEEVLAPANYKDTLVILDGSYIPKLPPSLKNFTILAIPKADENITACSAASVIAKVQRDDFMTALSELEEFAPYGFAKNKGYLTPEHLAAIKVYGPSIQHRLDVKPIKELLRAKKNV